MHTNQQNNPPPPPPAPPPYPTKADASRSSHPGGTHYWYGEHEIPAEKNFWSDGLEKEDDWMGGVGACSTDDFVDWKFEGIVLHYANISDMVLGRQPEGGIFLQQPKVRRSVYLKGSRVGAFFFKVGRKGKKYLTTSSPKGRCVACLSKRGEGTHGI